MRQQHGAVLSGDGAGDLPVTVVTHPLVQAVQASAVRSQLAPLSAAAGRGDAAIHGGHAALDVLDARFHVDALEERPPRVRRVAAERRAHSWVDGQGVSAAYRRHGSPQWHLQPEVAIGVPLDGAVGCRGAVDGRLLEVPDASDAFRQNGQHAVLEAELFLQTQHVAAGPLGLEAHVEAVDVAGAAVGPSRLEVLGGLERRLLADDLGRLQQPWFVVEERVVLGRHECVPQTQAICGLGAAVDRGDALVVGEPSGVCEGVELQLLRPRRVQLDPSHPRHRRRGRWRHSGACRFGGSRRSARC